MQSANCILMVRPADFAFNEETARDNEFQQSLPGRDVRQEALAEFAGAANQLQQEGVRVLVLEKQPGLPPLPDAVFPNNWFATDPEGRVHVFPMKTPNRQAETAQLPAVLQLLKEARLRVSEVCDWRQILGPEAVLEGTGSLIFDHPGKRVYAAVSERTQKEAVLELAARRNLEPVLFHTESRNGKPYYHTNVVMSIGNGTAVVCLECIPDADQRREVAGKLSRNHLLVEITRQQLEEGFCGNLLQVAGTGGKILTVLSATAFEALTQGQREILSQGSTLLPIPIPTLEMVGGGSIRCMMAEIFCPADQ